jgi:hypothetical protein
MLQILHKGNQISLDLDTSSFTGDIETDAALAYIQGLDAGRIIGINVSGYAALADGAIANSIHPVGFLINDAAGYFFENKPAIASKKVASTWGNCVIITDQIDTALTFTPSQYVYAGTSTKVGLVTNVPPTNARPIGITMSSASSASPNLTILVLG